MEIIGIKAKDFPDVAGLMAWHFDSFVERSNGEETVEHLISEVMNETKQCWIAWDGKVKACGLTQVVNSAIKVVEFTHCAGEDRDKWNILMVDEIKKWAKHIGATRIRMYPRPGHTKMLKQMGFKETHRIMEQNLE